MAEDAVIRLGVAEEDQEGLCSSSRCHSRQTRNTTMLWEQAARGQVCQLVLQMLVEQHHLAPTVCLAGQSRAAEEERVEVRLEARPA